MKKINAYLTCVTFVCMAAHMIAMALYMLGICAMTFPMIIIGRAVMGCFTLHAALSVIILFFNKSDSGKIYPKLNKRTMEQRITALALLVLIHFHANDYAHVENGAVVFVEKSLKTFLPELLLVVCANAHLMSSLDGVCVSLGIRNKAVPICIRLFMALVFVLSLAAVVMYFWGK